MAPKKGKKALETSPTAAAARSRRSTAGATEDAISPAVPTSKKRGRPAKTTTVPDEQAEPPKKRGRPLKTATEPEAQAEPPKKRGRPPKAATEPEAPAEPPRKRGRPSKGGATNNVASTQPVTEAKKAAKRGRPKKESAISDHPRARGEPPEGGETLKVAADREAAAEQLEEELLDTAEAEAATTESKGKASSKRKALPKSTDSTAKASKRDAPANNAPPAGKQYWLMKAEQEDRCESAHDGSTINTKFTIDDLKAKTVPEPWDGVRNHVAANNMRAMRKGDLAFFYASGGKQGRNPGIVGIMEVVSEAEADVTVSDPSAYGYVEKEADRGKWVVVGVAFRKKLVKPVSLKQLQEHKDGKLADMQLFKQSRLSVAKVSAAEWQFICDELIEGYEE